MKLHMLVLFVAITPIEAAVAANADAIYFGGPIVTVNADASAQGDNYQRRLSIPRRGEQGLNRA
jgi:hypothetical protein